ncbi:Protein SUPPRESSOR OF npr1-1, CONSTITUTIVE 1 [Morella rubra]|uniref:Protein SUPPRESSOR OF npr1-1, CONSTITUTIVE 1 n=1 Tax=Morella rubra TaxID=262757 RepID=A0A6A1WTH1_9ROSI|nr:Protein SUPPRESSOR OF npr1-1, CONSTITUTIVE 1 [Morella rubra]
MDFNPDNLIELKMRGSSSKNCGREINNIKQMWKGIQSLGNLKRFDLSGSQNLIETPDFTKVKNLEILDLEEFIWPFHIVFTRVHKTFNSSISILSLSTVRFLQLSGCRGLEEFPNMSSMECLEELYAHKTGITQFPSLNLRPKNMKTLRLGGFKALLRGKYSLFRCFSDLNGNEGIFHIKFVVGVSYVEMLHLEVARRGFLGFTYGPKIMYGSSLRVQMPDWFNNKSNGSSVTLPMHSECDENRKWLGYAMFFLYEKSGTSSQLDPWKVLASDEDTDPFSSICIQFDCEFFANFPQLPKAYVRGSRPSWWYEGCEFSEGSKVRAFIEGEEEGEKRVGRPLTTKVKAIKKHLQKLFKGRILNYGRLIVEQPPPRPHIGLLLLFEALLFETSAVETEAVEIMVSLARQSQRVGRCSRGIRLRYL